MNYTSIEQSKKLLELGLDIESADAFYIIGKEPVSLEVIYGEFCTMKVLRENYAYRRAMPCWSVNALLELMPFPILYMQMIGGGIFWGCKVQFPYDEQEPHIIDGQISQIDACYNMIVLLCENGLLGYKIDE